MKNKHLYSIILLASFAGIVFFVASPNKSEKKYTPRENATSNSLSAKGAIEYLTFIRANQYTKSIDPADIAKGQQQLNILSSKKSSQLTWIDRGPDNIGGRTRAILIDKDNSALMFAGGVSGGLWKSTTSGQIWEQVTYTGATAEDFANLAIVSICQTTNGDIYFGTGEGFYYRDGRGTGGFLGAGIWKSTDKGLSFSKLESTWTESVQYAFSMVNELAADATDPNTVYAATRSGLKVTKDGGVTWENAPMPNLTYDSKFSSDVKVSSNGTVIASVNNHCMVKKADQQQFVDRSGADEEDGGNLIAISDISRLEFAFSPQDPNLVFCLAANNSEQLRNIYKSTDGGDTWIIIGKGGSSLFQPLGTQGFYDMCIAVNPINKNQIFIGGLDLWVGDAANIGNLFAWNQVSLWTLSPLSSLYVHADLHTIVFNPKDPQNLFIGSDGGISRGYLNKDNIKYQFKTLNKNFNVTQFYSVAVNSEGQLLGGTQDNGSLLITGNGNTTLNAKAVTGGDGGHSAMSQIMPNIGFATIYYGGLWRNNDKDFADWNYFYSADLCDFQGWSSGTFESDAQQAAFVTPIAYWETDNDPFVSDTIDFITRRAYTTGEKIVFPSYNINKAPIPVTLEKDYATGDTIRYQDPYSSLFALGMKSNLWLTRKAANWNITFGKKDWWQAVKLNTALTGEEYVTQMVFSADGDHLFFSTSDNEIYRLSNLNQARTYNEGDYYLGKNIKTVLTKIGQSESNRTITRLAVDPNNIQNLIVTLGNYGSQNTIFVYMCTTANSATASNTMLNFTNITGNLPQIPTYCALFEMDATKQRVLLGTDLGVFMTENIFTQMAGGNSISWTPEQNGAGPVPVFQITQQTNQKWANNNYGVIYIGTHGRGFFENRTYLGINDKLPDGNNTGSKKSSVNIYPNPVVNNAKVSMVLNQSGNVSIEIISVSGKVVKQFSPSYLLKGENTVDLALDELPKGTYLVQVKSGNLQATSTFIKQ